MGAPSESPRRGRPGARSPERTARAILVFALLPLLGGAAIASDASRALASFGRQCERTERTLIERVGADLSAESLPETVAAEWEALLGLRTSFAGRVRTLEVRASSLPVEVSSLEFAQRDLQARVTALDRETEAWRKRFTDLATEADRCLAAIDAHAQRRPGGKASRAAVNAYNAEARRLQTWYEGLASRRTRLQQESADREARDRALKSLDRDLQERKRLLAVERADLRADEQALVRECADAEARARALLDEKTRVIGAAGAVSGLVTATRPWGGALVPIVSGSKLYLGDDLQTDADGRMQILLLDETVFTVGPDTDLTLDEFVYDPFAEAGRLTATLAKGAIRFVSGLIAAKTPRNVEVKLPVGSIGVRGTDFTVRVGADGASRIDVLGGGVDFTPAHGGDPIGIEEGHGLDIGADGSVGAASPIDVRQAERSFEEAGGPRASQPDAPPPFTTRDYVILAVALLVVLVTAWNYSGSNWEIVPMCFLAMLFVISVEATSPFEGAGRWWFWWSTCSLAGYVVVRLVLALVLEVAKEVAGLLRRVWPVTIVLGAAVSLGGLLVAASGVEILTGYFRRYAFVRGGEPPPAPDQGLMFFSWAIAGAGAIVILAGLRLATADWNGRRLLKPRLVTPARTPRRVRPRRAPRAEPRDRPVKPAKSTADAFRVIRPPLAAAPRHERPRCPVCTQLFAEHRVSQCARCRKSVHRATCLSDVQVSGGRLCRACGSAPVDADEPAPTPDASLTCSGCGTAVEDDDRFCGHCGQPLGGNA